MYGAHVAKTRETSSDSSTLRTLTHCRPIFERLPNFDQIPFVSQVELIAMPDVVDAEVAEASVTVRRYLSSAAHVVRRKRKRQVAQN